MNREQGRIVWVGDSRAYLWRKSELKLLTRDHSFLEALREQGLLTEEELRGHPNRNLVTQTLGLGDPTPSTLDVSLEAGDWLVLCSDGLNDELEDHDIAGVLVGKDSPEAGADALIAAALASGGRDNVSVVIVEAQGPDETNRRTQGSALLPIVVGVGLAIGIVVIWWLTR